MATGTIQYEAIEKLLASAQESGRRNLTESETKALLAHAGLAVAEERQVADASEAAAAAEMLGFPVVMKVVSADLPHKSDVGGVRLGLSSPDAVRRAYAEILANVRERAPDARVEGIVVQQQLEGVEVILGATRDPQFGPVIVFGLGGTAVEVLGDVAFRLIPLTERDAWEMLAEIKAAPLLDGFRGAPPVDKRSIVNAALGLSGLVARFATVIEELDVNPLVVTPEGAVAVDGVAVLSPREAT